MLLLACAGDDGGSSATDSSATTEPSEGSEGSEGSAGSDGGSLIDEDFVVAEALGYADNFVKINAVAEGSQHGLADTVNYWVQPEHEVEYRSIDPATHTPELSFPVGTIMVKEHLDAMGEFAGLTVMAKAEPGYNPDQNDWWFANIGADMGVNESGKIGYCFSCHDGNGTAPTDYLYGVPADKQTAP
ncbi:MAG: hypothetical protein H6713_23485 [Myxococcales bacterium]|nr:hypothetical protein [Myxococcales bacterium]